MLNGKTATMHIDGVQRTVRLSAKANDATVTIKAYYNIDDGVDVSKVTFKNKSRQKKHKVRIVSDSSKTSTFDLTGTTASGIGTDGLTPVIEIGTARGTATINPGHGASVTVVRNLLVAELVSIGIDAVASGPDQITVAMDVEDGDYIEFGSTDTGLGLDASLFTD